jgi:hypothetical protein
MVSAGISGVYHQAQIGVVKVKGNSFLPFLSPPLSSSPKSFHTQPTTSQEKACECKLQKLKSKQVRKK